MGGPTNANKTTARTPARARRQPGSATKKPATPAKSAANTGEKRTAQGNSAAATKSKKARQGAGKDKDAPSTTPALSAEDFQAFLAFKALQEAGKAPGQTAAQAKAAEDAAIQRANEQMLTEETTPSDPFEAPRMQNSLSSDEAAFARLIHGPPARMPASLGGEDEPTASDNEPADINLSSDASEEEDDNVNGNDTSAAVGEDNDLVVRHDGSEDEGAGRTGPAKEKVTQEHFTPRSLRVANLSKLIVREGIALTHAFPAKKEHFLWESIKAAARTVGQDNVLHRADSDPDLEDNLTKYAGYAITGLRGDLKTRAQQQISGHYGIPGDLSAAAIKSNVEWLLKKSNFTCAELDLTKRTVNREKPYANGAIAALVRGQWFSKGKSDLRAYNVMLEQNVVPGPIIVLVVTCLEYALREWVHGHQESLNFSDEHFSATYTKHAKNWKTFCTRSPSYVMNLQKDVFMGIMRVTNKLHLVTDQDDGDDFDDVNFDELEMGSKLGT